MKDVEAAEALKPVSKCFSFNSKNNKLSVTLPSYKIKYLSNYLPKKKLLFPDPFRPTKNMNIENKTIIRAGNNNIQ